MAGRRHPVGRQLHVTQLFDASGSDVGERLADRHSPGSRRIEQGQRRTLAHRHRLAGVHVETGGGDGHVADRHLPGADHLVAADQAGHGPVADGDEKAFVGHRREPQHPRHGGGEIDTA